MPESLLLKLIKAEASLKRTEELARISKLALDQAANNSPEQARLQVHIAKVDANVATWKEKIQGFKDQLAQP